MEKPRKFYVIYFVDGFDPDGYVNFSTPYDTHIDARARAMQWHDQARIAGRFEHHERVIPYHKLASVGVFEQ